MHYTFVDIGCSFWGVSTEQHGLAVSGLLVEPIPEFLQVLPKSDSVRHVNLAVGNQSGPVDLNVYWPKDPSVIKYYTSEYLEKIYKDWQANPTDQLWYNFIQEHPLLGPVIGCGGTSILNRTDIPLHYHTIEKRSVNMITLEQLVEDYDISEVDHLKIDVEGGEEQILIQLINLLQQQKLRVNKTIKYECNFLSDEKLLMNLGKYICKQFGYESEYVCTGWNEDMILRRVG